MSGFEIVGVVLGALPLAMNAVSQYGQGVSKIRDLRHYSRLFDDINTRLRHVHWVMRQISEQLLEGLNLEDDFIAQLLTVHLKWDDESLNAALLERIREQDLLEFQVACNNIMNKLGLLADQLGMNGWNPPFIIDGDIDKRRRNKFFKALVKVRGAFNATEHHALLDSITVDVTSLRECVKASIKLKARHTSGSSQTQASAFSDGAWLVSRGHSICLYESFRSRLFSRECSHHHHHAQMRFKIHGIDFFPWQSEGPLYCSLMLEQKSRPDELPFWQHWRSVITPQPSAISSAHEASETITDAAHHPQSTIEPPSLCSMFTASPSHNSSRGSIDSDHRYHVHDDPDETFEEGFVETRSLRACISDMQTRFVPSTRERKRIAYLLALAVLQLHGTRWLQQSWGLDHVFTQGEELHVPWTTSQFRPEDQGPGANFARDIFRNETLFSLGEALVELTTLQPLPSADVPTRYGNAIGKAKKIQGEESRNFSSAVASCLLPSSPSLDFDLESTAFRRWYCENVVQPLKDDYDVFLGNALTYPVQHRPAVAPSPSVSPSPLPSLGSASPNTDMSPSQSTLQPPSLAPRSSGELGAGFRSRLIRGIKQSFAEK